MTLAGTIRDFTRNAIVNARLERPAMDLSVVMQPDGYFAAIDRNNYDVDCDHTGFFTKSPTGYGRTPLDAIVDLLDSTASV